MDIFSLLTTFFIKNRKFKKIFNDYSLTKVKYLKFYFPDKKTKYLKYYCVNKDICLYNDYISVDMSIAFDIETNETNNIVDFSKNNNYNLCRDLYDILQIKCNRKTFNESIKDKNSDLYQWIQNNKHKWKDIYFEYIIKINYLELCQAIYDKEYHYDYDGELFTCTAAEIGSLEIYKWLYDQGYTINSICLFLSALEGRSVELCRFLYERGLHENINDILEEISSLGSLEFFQLVYSNENYLNETIFFNAIKSKSLDLCKWLYKMKCPFDKTKIFYFGIISNSIKICEWIHNLGFRCTKKYFDYAVKYGSFKICKWLYEKGYDYFNKNTPKEVVYNKWFKMCKWLYSINKFPLNNKIFIYAIENGSLKICKWLYSLKCPHKKNILNYVNKNLVSYKIEKWLKDNF